MIIVVCCSFRFLAPLYGLVIHDKFVAIPNGLGLLMCLIQYGVWSISYPSATTTISYETAGVANSNSSSRAESRNALLQFFKHQPEKSGSFAC